ncbi:cation:proton antiporter [Candidatus Woesearchaeota archaeon]|nr:cation:proton antiporter [Candidatus Woesearchaeota archaeon]
MDSPLLMLLIVLTAATVLGEIAKRIGIPAVVGQIAAGLLLSTGPIKQLIFTDNSLETLGFLSNLGVILLFYYIGLKTDFKSFTKNAKKAVSVSLLNTLIPFALTYAIMSGVFHLDKLASAAIGMAASVSAQAVSVELLEELKIIRTKIGQSIIVTGAVDDIIELGLISALLSVMQITSTETTITKFAIETAAFLTFVIAARMWLIPKALKYFEKEKSTTTIFTGSLIIVLIIATLAEKLSLGALMGAIIAGIVIRQTIHKDVTIPNWEEHDISKSIHTISSGLLIPLFFVWTGLTTNLAEIQHVPLLTAVLITTSTIGTVGSTLLGVVINKGTLKEGLLTGWGLNPKGDVELVIAALGLKAGLISSQIFSSIVVMSITTSIISPIIFQILARKWLPQKRR